MNESLKLIRQLVEDFKQQESAFLSPAYQESRVRQDFIDKFFTALGWDVTHLSQKNPYEQEVVIENRVHAEGSQRRADYAFHIAPNFRDVKFFAEAKKPSRNLANPDDYYQAIRYGWNKKTSLVVLTDFEEFHIIDCRYEPDIATALDRKLESFHYSEYADEEKFARIFYLFGREAVAAGSLEKFAASLPKPKGKVAKKGVLRATYKAVDESFLELLDGYREMLAKEFKNKNQQLDGEELTEAVQRTLDRFVFIRFLEDKSIEEASIVGLSSKSSTWNAFTSLCRSLEPKYNGLVFKQHRVIDGDDFIPPDNDVFGTICRELSDPASPYDFDKIPISILGSIYERFLGKVVSATEKRAKVEEKPEVRKAGGVYYTPEYIVRYIVKETVGKLIEGKTPAEIAKMAFADIACGSGSFLLEVYGTLLDYHTRWYNEHADKAKKGDVETRDGALALSLKKRQQILTNNIYGVDIDAQAYEVTQVSLYLKLLEEATMSEGYQFALLKEKLLPDLKENIICGNSLIERDIETQTTLFDHGATDVSDIDALKPMNFADAFPEIMRRGGFDAIVGNPPYGAIINSIERKYFADRFTVFSGVKDVYPCFMERAVRSLKAGGILSYIVPSAWIGGPDYFPLRAFMIGQKILRILLLPFDVFKDAYVDTLVFAVQKSSVPNEHKVETFVFGKRTRLQSIDLSVSQYASVSQKDWLTSKDNKFILSASVLRVLSKIKKLTSLIFDDVVLMKRGVLFDKNLLTTKRTSGNSFRYFEGDVYRYQINSELNNWIEYDDRLRERPKEFAWFEGSRILLRRLVNRKQRLMATWIEETFISNKNLYSLLQKKTDIQLKFVLAILNSNLISHLYINQVTQASKDDFPQVTIRDLLSLPFPNPDKSRHDNIVKLVEQMLAAKEKLAQSKTDAETHRLEAHCASLDRQIDAAVYELYGLTEEEIKIMEGRKW